MTNAMFETVSKQIDDSLVEPLRQLSMARKLIPKVMTVPEGTWNVEYFTASEMGDAIISYDLAQTQLADTIGATPSVIKIPVLRKDFKMGKQSLQAMQKYGIDWIDENAKSANYKVKRKEEVMLLTGWAPNGTNYTVATGGCPGLYSSANAEATSSDFGTAGNAKIETGLVQAKLAGYGVVNRNLNLTLNPTQYFQLMSSQYTYSNQFEYLDVLRMLNPNPSMPQGQIFVSSDMTAGTGLYSVVDTTGEFFDLIMLKEQHTVLMEDPNFPAEIAPVKGFVISAMVPRIKNSYGLISATGI